MENKPRVYQPLEYDEMPGEMVMLADYAKLETELRDTRRALEMALSGYSTPEDYVEQARRERTEEIKGRLAE